MPDELKEPDQQQADDESRKLDAAMGRYEGSFVESADIMTRPVTLIIASVVPPGVECDAKKKKIEKPIIGFEKANKRLILGRTNERILKAIHGKKASGWLGKPITLVVRYLAEAFGERNVPTIRILPPADVPLPMSARKFFGSEHPRTSEG